MINVIKSEHKPEMDLIYKRGLKNEGNYDGCFYDVGDTLHTMFRNSYLQNQSVDELRYVLINEWNPSYFGKRRLFINHLVRADGSIRDTIEEISYAIKEIYDYGGMLSRGIFNTMRFFVPRKKSYLMENKKKKSKSKSKSNRQSNNERIQAFQNTKYSNLEGFSDNDSFYTFLLHGKL